MVIEARRSLKPRTHGQDFRVALGTPMGAVTTGLRVDSHQLSFELWPYGAQLIPRLLLVLHDRAIDPDISSLVVDEDVVGVRHRLWSSRSRAGALSEDLMPVFLVVDSGLEKLHGCHTPVGFGAHQQVQIILLRTSIAASRGHGDLAKDSLCNRDPLLDRRRFRQPDLQSHRSVET